MIRLRVRNRVFLQPQNKAEAEQLSLPWDGTHNEAEEKRGPVLIPFPLVPDNVVPSASGVDSEKGK